MGWRTIRLALAAWLAASGCTVKLIGDYDEATDKGATALHRKVETFLTKLERTAGTPAGAHGALGMNFYPEAMVDTRALMIRARAIPQNEITVEMLDLVAKNLGLLEELHKAGIGAPEQVAPLRAAFDAQFTAILRLELAKKRGD